MICQAQSKKHDCGKAKIVEKLRGIHEVLKGAQDDNISLCDLDGKIKGKIRVKHRLEIVEKILEHLENSNDDLNTISTMIDAESGYGKTYDIGLWSYVLGSAGVNHLISVPNVLVDQTHKMIKDIFPVEICTPKTIEELQSTLEQKTPMTIIVKYSLLLAKENFTKLEKILSIDQLWISIDEADSIKHADDFYNMCKLNKKYPITYLTSTPKERILDLCSYKISPRRTNKRSIVEYAKPVDIVERSNQEEKFKKKLVVLAICICVVIVHMHLLVPILNKHIAIMLSSISRAYPYRYITDFIFYRSAIGAVFFVTGWVICPVLFKAFDVNVAQLLHRVGMNIHSLFIHNDRLSPVYGYIEKCEDIFVYNDIVESQIVDANDLHSIVRWKVNSPIGDSALILADDVSDRMNLNFALNNEDKIYSNGKTSRFRHGEIYDMYKPEGESYEKYREDKRKTKFVECIKSKYPNITEKQIEEMLEMVDFSNTADYLEYKVMHEVIDLTLQYLTGYDDNFTLDKYRKENLLELIEKVKEKLKDENVCSKIGSFLEEKGFSKNFSSGHGLQPQIRGIITILKEVDNNKQRLIIDNWHLDKKLHNLYKEQKKQSEEWSSLSKFCMKNKCIFAGLGKNSLGIEECRNFFSIAYDEKNDKYKPKYCDYDSKDIDILTKLALITTVADESKGRGLDTHYNNIGLVFTESDSKLNHPTEALQNVGRNRENNPYRQSYVVIATGNETEVFVKEPLEKRNDSPEAFSEKVSLPALDRYNELKKKSIGIELGKRIEAYINKAGGELAQYCKEHVNKTYEAIDEINDFRSKETEKDMKNALKSAKEYLKAYEHRIKTNDKLSVLSGIEFSVVSVIAKTIYYLWSAFDYIIFKIYAYHITEVNPDEKDVVAYAYVITHYNFEEILKCERIIDKAYKIVQSVDEEERVNLFNSLLSKSSGLRWAISLLLKCDSKHLLTILNAVYKDENNADRLDMVKDGKFANEEKHNHTDVSNFITYVREINREIVRCHAYYHSINEIPSIKRDEPKLKSIEHKLFDVKAIYNQKQKKLHRIGRSIAIMLLPYFIKKALELGILWPSHMLFYLSWLILLAFIKYYPDFHREFLFAYNIDRCVCNDVNELEWISKHERVKDVEQAIGIICDLKLCDLRLSDNISCETMSNALEGRT